MLEQVTISAPARLHFGLFSVGDAVARKFGGIGLMIDSPRTVVTATRSDELKICGPGQTACRIALENWFSTMRISLADSLGVARLEDLPVGVEIESLPPRHSGFGSGTQLALASAMAVTRVLGISTPSPGELAHAVGRGARSGIGSHGFGRGGFLVDRGKLTGESLAPLDFQSDFPEPWTIVTVILEDSKGLSGELESSAFENLRETSESQRNAMIEIVRDRIIPGVVQSDYELFADGVYDFGRQSGMMFAEIQGGPYNGTPIESLIETIRGFGVTAVGQSSWGPCVYGITRDVQQAKKLETFLLAEYGNQCEIRVSKADNVGAKTVQRETVK